MKHLVISLLLAGGLTALSTMDANAVVCARGVVRAGVEPRSLHDLLSVRLPALLLSRRGGSLFAAGSTDNPATRQLNNMPCYQRLIGSQGRTAPY